MLRGVFLYYFKTCSSLTFVTSSSMPKVSSAPLRVFLYSSINLAMTERILSAPFPDLKKLLPKAAPPVSRELIAA